MLDRTNRLLIITHEHIGPRMAGPGIRAWEIARAVAHHGIEVILATPYPETVSLENPQIVGFSWEDTASLERWLRQADVIMATGPVLSRVLHCLGRPLPHPTIVDVYYVAEIEQLILAAQRGVSFPMLTDLLIEETLAYLRQGDLFVCATERQRDFWLGALWMSGRLNEDTVALNPEAWIALVPMGIPEDPPQWDGPVLKGVVPGIGPNDKVILWLGGLWEWTDTQTLFEALAHVFARRSDVRVVFGAAQHFDPQVVPPMSRAGQFVERCRAAGWLGRFVFFLGWIPYAQRGAYLLEADVGLSLHDHPLESRYAIRARSLDYLWASLPCVLSAGDVLAEQLEAWGLARLAGPGDARAVADALLALLEDPPPRPVLTARTRSLREAWTWPRVVRPIVDFVRRPERAPDADRARGRIPALLTLRKENDLLRQENRFLQAHLEAIRRGRLVRLLNAIYGLWGRRYL